MITTGAVKQEFVTLLSGDISLFDFSQRYGLHGFIYDNPADSAYAYVSPAFWTALGYATALPPGLLASLLATDTALATQSEREAVHQVTHQAGHRVTVRTRTRLLSGPDGSARRLTACTCLPTSQSAQPAGADTPALPTAPLDSLLHTVTSNSLLRTIMDSLPILIYIKDTESRKLFVNRAEYMYMGATSARDIIGKSDYELYPAESARQSILEDQLVMNSGIPMLGQETLNARHGHDSCWFLSSKIPLYDEQGKPAGLLGISLDITARKQAELELQRTSDMLERTNQVARVGGWELNLQTQDIYFSRITREIHEVPDDYVPTLETAINFYKEGHSRDTITKAVATCIEQGTPYALDLQISTYTGRELWVRAVGQGKFVDGQCVALIGTFQDIDEQKRTQRLAQESADMLRKLSDRVPGCLYLFQSFDDGHIAFPYLSTGATELFELDLNATDTVAETLLSRIHPEDMPALIETSRLSRTTLTNWNADFRVVLPRQGERWIHADSVPEQLADSTLWHGYFQDVTARKHSETELIRARQHAEEASRSKSEFLANMSHEIRTPLNGVIGFTDLLMRTQLDPLQQEYMSTVYHSANSLLDVISDILDFSKIEAGKLDLSIEKTDLYDIGSQVADMIKYQAHQKGLEMLLNIAPDVPRYIWTDPVRLRQILVNLLGNAVKFTEYGEIELRVDVRPGPTADQIAFRFEVQDSGIGIAPQHQQKIFDAFAQADSSTTRRFGGTGLGLTISNKLLSLMGSHLQLTSVENQGSTFFFDVLFRAEPGEPLDCAIITGLDRVLIVDDNATNRLIVQNMLNLKGIASDQSSNGIDALEKLKRGPVYDLVLMDYHMPYMDGIETIRQIRRTLNYSADQLPIILLGSSADDAYVEAVCHTLSVQQHLIKPIKIQPFFQALAQIHQPQSLPIPLSAPVAPATPLVGEQTVLIVEDNSVNMMLASAILRSVSPTINLLTAQNGREGVDVFIRSKPDLILMDIQMPEMNGYEATAAIRALDAGQTVPIIALTAGIMKSERERCLNAGMNDYITKPVVKDTIARILHQWLPAPEPVVPAPPMPNQPIATLSMTAHFDEEELRARVGGDKAFMTELLSEVNDYLAGFPAELHHHRTRRDWTEVKAVAHKLKGSALNLSFGILATLASEVEQLASAGEGEARIVELESELQAEIELLQTLI
ncbi:PAS domain S-box-containing protein [Spirosoma oryzae]|uniref:histidine kinase n=1 Tax=Spirosoma oryzae TaxID=1469603 RepID=A0A2T0TP99_9BACT|nr:response regulator [Spirosoma oryzae]PRY47358.1 PAS domain S-box-containing protein [Spirosoma oryzae]